MAATETHAKVVASARWLKKALWFALGRATLQKKGLERWRFGSCPFCRRILLLTPRAELWSTCINLFHHHMLFLASFSSFACLSMQALPSGLVEAVVREMKWLCLLQHSLSPWVPGWWAVHHYAVGVHPKNDDFHPLGAWAPACHGKSSLLLLAETPQEGAFPSETQTSFCGAPLQK